MNSKPRARFWIEIGLTITSGFLLALTIVWRDWIEIIFKVDPDENSGSLEWLIVIALVVTTVAFALLARSEWQRRRAPAN